MHGDQPVAADGRPRCDWGAWGDPLYLAYHDEEWGVPSRDERHLFEMLVLEGAQAGLSWSCLLYNLTLPTKRIV
jgi:DNA-3-methyladenine glycosylase I